MKRIVRSTMQTAANLVFFAIIGTAILAATYGMTHEVIERTIEAEKLKLISQILPPASYDNDIMQDEIAIEADAMLGTATQTVGHVARRKGVPVAIVLESIAPDGYAGKIALILAIRANGEIAGVRVVSHKETPGLGDYIEFAKNPWISLFEGKSRTVWGDIEWRVKKDGGQFEHMAGATITPRAIVKAVNKSLLYFAAHRDALFAQNPNAHTERKP